MPDWTIYDPQLRQFAAEGMSTNAMAKRLGFPRQTVADRLRKLGLKAPQQSTPMKVSPAQEPTMSDDTNTAGAEVHYDAVNEFDALPEGYAKVIQPMRPYSDAEEFALNESMRLFGFVGAIVRDQYGRILDGNQRARVARLRGLGVPFTVTQVKDDAHAIALATSLNAVRRQYPRAEREQLALAYRPFLSIY